MIERRSEESQTVDERNCSGGNENQVAGTSTSCRDEYLQACWGYDPSSFHYGPAAEDPRHTFLQRYLFLINTGCRVCVQFDWQSSLITSFETFEKSFQTVQMTLRLLPFFICLSEICGTEGFARSARSPVAMNVTSGNVL